MIDAWGLPWLAPFPFWFPQPEFPTGDGGSSGEDAPSDDESDEESQCFAQLKYRPVDHPIANLANANHAFWWVQDRTGAQSIISAGPAKGFLRVWVVGGDTNGQDNKSQTTHFATILAAEVCDSVDLMLAAARTFPKASIHYRPTGPNSNSAARFIGEAGGFAPSAPPGAYGWDILILTGPKRHDSHRRPRAN